ncbi:hypothetical protein [Streptomyces ficellus]|uniref:Uncharacterized protein n=1 Tax=Streptomyces ficellus TaxID=1977088 RepID=A0A6I6FFU6_9ACTN|nr:hypothetical protein [Streptomyces ficellus]QGV79977.1 hypothetical protein EIZ62_18380 [Streptomyces ficellus]
MKTLEVAAVASVVVEVVLMALARFGTERRHWRHHHKRGPRPVTSDHITHVPAVLYGLAAVAVAVAAVVSPVEMGWDAAVKFVTFGILLPALAANSVMVLAARGRASAVTRLQRCAAFAVALGGGGVSVGLVL